jgi:hypothetical protein
MAKAVKKTANNKTKPAAKKSSSPAKSSVPANAMNYREHEDTYELFLALSKWTVIFCAALLISMMVGFFLGGGLIGGTLLFLILLLGAYFALSSGFKA